MVKLSTEDCVELCLLCEGGFDYSVIKEISEVIQLESNISKIICHVNQPSFILSRKCNECLIHGKAKKSQN